MTELMARAEVPGPAALAGPETPLGAGRPLTRDEFVRRLWGILGPPRTLAEYARDDRMATAAWRRLGGK